MRWVFILRAEGTRWAQTLWEWIWNEIMVGVAFLGKDYTHPTTPPPN